MNDTKDVPTPDKYPFTSKDYRELMESVHEECAVDGMFFGTLARSEDGKAQPYALMVLRALSVMARVMDDDMMCEAALGKKGPNHEWIEVEVEFAQRVRARLLVELPEAPRKAGPVDESKPEITQIVPASALRVMAECHTDDRVHVVSFDATPWFEKAPVEDIRALIKCEWGGDYAADYVAQHIEPKPPELKALFDYLHSGLPKQPCGFEVEVDRIQARAWLKANRPGWPTGDES